MTMLQIKVAIAAARKSSISPAAAELGIAQPNASHSIKKLEEELGFPIFKKRGNKLTPTEEGYRFLEQAEKMVRADNAIRSIVVQRDAARLRVGVINYTPATEAFIKFCREQRNSALADLICVNVDAEYGAQRLKERLLDIVITVAPKNTLPVIKQICNDYHLEYKSLCEIPVCVRMRKDHPLLADGTFDGSIKNLKRLSSYPYIEYSNIDSLFSSHVDTHEIPFGCSYIISVDERQTRLQTIAATNGYSIGCHILPSRLDHYGLVEVPIANESVQLLSIIRHGDSDLPDICRYEKFLEAEVSAVFNANTGTSGHSRFAKSFIEGGTVKRIETPDLVLRKARADDLEHIFNNVWKDPELSKMMLWKNTADRDEAVIRLDKTMDYQAKTPAFFVCLKDTDEPIGFAGMKATAPGVYEDCGICIATAHQNKGYGKEVVKALVECAFKDLDAKRFIYGCWHENLPSAAVCRSLGFTYLHSCREIRQADGVEYDADYYELLNESKN